MLERSTLASCTALRAGALVEGLHTCDTKYGPDHACRPEDGKHVFRGAEEPGDIVVHVESVGKRDGAELVGYACIA